MAELPNLQAGGTAADSNDPSPSVAELRARKKVAGGTVDDTQVFFNFEFE